MYFITIYPIAKMVWTVIIIIAFFRQTLLSSDDGDRVPETGVLGFKASWTISTFFHVKFYNFSKCCMLKLLRNFEKILIMAKSNW